MGLGALLGGLANGYAGAAQQDQSRKFEDEQTRRASMGDLFGRLMSDETADPALRAWALKQRLAIPQAPYKPGKPYQPDFTGFPAGKPAQPAQGVTQPPIGAAPPPPPAGMMGPRQFPANMPQMGSVQPPAAASQSLPPGVAGPPAPPDQAPAVSFMPPPPPPSLLTQPGQSVNLAAQPAQPIQPFMSPEQHTAMLASREGAGAKSQLSGQIEARQEVLPDTGISDEDRAAFSLGIPNYWRAMSQSALKGEGYAGQLRAEGEPVPANIPDNQWVKSNTMVGGRKTYAASAAPGEQSGGNGTLTTPGQRNQQNAATRYGFWQKENQTGFSQRMALQDRQFQNSIMSGDYGKAKTIVFGADKDYAQAIQRMHTMDENYNDFLKTGSQQAQLSLLSNHLGMTAGLQKGMRIGKTVMDEAQQSAPTFSLLANKFFHQDTSGDWIFDGPKSGLNLTKDQAGQMVTLAHQKANILHDTIDQYNQSFTPELTAPGAARGTPAKGKTSKPSSAGPPRPPLDSFARPAQQP